ncbi:MAG: F0F1 ATP synthase subunit B [Planctomycetes bacterium]|nr:F0F1 ATP synthase subunit B [Planctomycetota bacterium]
MRFAGSELCGVAAFAAVALFPALLPAAEEAGAAGMPISEPVLTTFAWTILVFLIVLAILWRTAWSPLLKALDEREGKIRASLEAAERALAQSKERELEHERVLMEARRQASAIVEEGKRDAQSVKESIVAESRREAEAITRRATADIERAKDNAIHELHQRTVDLSLKIAEKVIRKSLSAKDHEELVRDTIKEYQQLNA